MDSVIIIQILGVLVFVAFIWTLCELARRIFRAILNYFDSFRK